LGVWIRGWTGEETGKQFLGRWEEEMKNTQEYKKHGWNK
jgi:hypothetical protein